MLCERAWPYGQPGGSGGAFIVVVSSIRGACCRQNAHFWRLFVIIQILSVMGPYASRIVVSMTSEDLPENNRPNREDLGTL